MSSEFLLINRESAIQNRFAETCPVRFKRGNGRFDWLNQQSFSHFWKRLRARWLGLFRR